MPWRRRGPRNSGTNTKKSTTWGAHCVKIGNPRSGRLAMGVLRQCASAQNPQELCCEVVEGRGNDSDFKQDESKETEISR